MLTIVLLAGVFSLALLAKHSFGLPHSSRSHWISQVCKMRERQGPAALQALAHAVPYQPVVVVIHRDPVPAKVCYLRDGDRPQISDLFPHATLRAPPSFV